MKLTTSVFYILLGCYSFETVTAKCVWKTCNNAYKKCLNKGTWKFCKPDVLNEACGKAGSEGECTQLKERKCKVLLDYGTEGCAKYKGCTKLKKRFACDELDTTECTEDCPHVSDKVKEIKGEKTKDVDDEKLYIYTDMISKEDYELMAKFGDLGEWEYNEDLGIYAFRRKLTSAKLSAEKRGLDMLSSIKAYPLDNDTIGSITGKITQGNWAEHLDLRADSEFFEKVIIDTNVGKGEDIASNVYGADNRYVYKDTSYPWSTVGRVATTGGGACTGTMVGRNLMLTGGHCMQWNADGTVGAFSFTPAYYNGDAPFGTAWATSVYYWMKAAGPGLTDQESAYDYVVAVLNTSIGDLTGYAGYKVYSSTWNGGNYWQNTGYPGPLTGGIRPVFSGSGSIDTEEPQALAGAPDASVLGTRIDTQRGQSGGNAWGWWSGEFFPRIVGVCSAQAGTPTASGTLGDNDFGGGQGLWDLISYARENVPNSTF